MRIESSIVILLLPVIFLVSYYAVDEFSLEDYILKNDFFMCTERGYELISLRNRGDFSGMELLVLNYIDEMGSNIDDRDSAFKILKHLVPMIDVLDQVEIHYSSANNLAMIYYRGLTGISSESNFVLHTSTRGNSIYAMIGFHYNEWVYAERARIRLKNGYVIGFSMTNSAKELINDFEIRERTVVRLTNSDIADLLVSEVDVIRFEFDGNNHIDDRDLSKAEQNAFSVIYQFRDMNYFTDLKVEFLEG